MKKRSIQELTIRDNFMFGAVMVEEENCRRFLEMVLGFPIRKVIVSKEKSMIYHPEYKGVRLDIYADDENGTHYNVEMQATFKEGLGKRSRYYHSQVDMELLKSGEDYDTLPDTYVIFVCDFDPYGEGLYCYTFENRCKEQKELMLQDGCTTIFLSTKGRNRKDVSEELVKFLEFVGADLEESEKESEDGYVRQLQASVRKIKSDREMGERYMTLEEMLRDERKEGREEGRKEGRILMRKMSILECLEVKGELPREWKACVDKLDDEEKLDLLFKRALGAKSLEDFEESAKDILNL